MELKIAKLKDLQELNYGDQIIMDNPMFQTPSAYVFFSKTEDDRFYFKDMFGGSLMINSQETLNGFKVKIIDEHHELWEQVLYDHGKEIGEMLAALEDVEL